MNLQLFLGLKYLPAGNTREAIVHRVFPVDFLMASQRVLGPKLLVTHPTFKGQIFIVRTLMFVQFGFGIESLGANFTPISNFLPRCNRNLTGMLHNRVSVGSLRNRRSLHAVWLVMIYSTYR